jgi:selenoprotein W-related protein
VGLVTELLTIHESEIESITLIPSEGGRYEIKVNDKLVYSKLQTGRHADPGEVLKLVEEIIQNK